MRTSASSARTRVLKIIVSSGFVLSFAGEALAGPEKTVKVTATGQIVSREFCSATELCQEVHVTGNASQIGRVSGVLFERVDVTTGRYAGTGVFTTPDGSTITTQFAGQAGIPDQDGRTPFAESHQVVSGTGQFENASGSLDLQGTGDANGQLVIVGIGTFIKG